MRMVFLDVAMLDYKSYSIYSLSEDILMEHAALGMLKVILKKRPKSVMVVSGVGNNGADGIALVRLLKTHNIKTNLFLPFGVKSQMAKLQLKRAKSLNINIINSIKKCDVLVDCLFGSGLNKELNEQSKSIINKMNKINSYKVACDVPSGLFKNGQFDTIFKADVTVTMGAEKLSLYSDKAKDFVGKIKVANLGLPYLDYVNPTNYFVLEKSDLKLPNRNKKNTNKGHFGHSVLVAGDKTGAGIISAIASNHFGSGLISIL